MRHLSFMAIAATFMLIATGCMSPSDATPPLGEQPDVLELTRIYMAPLAPGEALGHEANEGLFTPGMTFDQGTTETPAAVVPDVH